MKSMDEQTINRTICSDCQQPVTESDIAFDDGQGFVACKPCCDAVDEDWKRTKEALKEMGIDPDKCDHIERAIAKGIGE